MPAPETSPRPSDRGLPDLLADPGPNSALPISDDEFARAMAPLGPYEPAPLLAVAVSGGPDSMALALLAGRWAAARRGAAVALLVDHRLRAASGGEAATAARALAPFAIAAKRMTVTAPPPAAGIPEWARDERYRLIDAAAQGIGALHVLLGHHAGDQAETVQMRQGRGSGVKGLAGMRPVRRGPAVRYLRPLLAFSKLRLGATAAAAGLPVADDPSNRDPAYTRTRVRAALGSGGGASLAAVAARMAVEDDALEAALAGLVARSVAFSPTGAVAIDRRALLAAPETLALRLLMRAAHAAGGRADPPRQARAAALLAALREAADCRRTLGRARVVARDGVIQLWREPAPPPRPETLPAGLWDGRFRYRASPTMPPGAVVDAIGYLGLRQAEAADWTPAWVGQAPRQALAALPGLWLDGCLTALPNLAETRGNSGLSASEAGSLCLWARFCPERPLAPC